MSLCHWPSLDLEMGSASETGDSLHRGMMRRCWEDRLAEVYYDIYRRVRNGTNSDSSHFQASMCHAPYKNTHAQFIQKVLSGCNEEIQVEQAIHKGSHPSWLAQD